MTTATQLTIPGRWGLPFLAALIAALAAILLGTTASASAAGVAENRVGAFNVTGEVPVEPPQHKTPGKRLGNDAAEPEIVVATGVAAKSVDDLGRLLGHADLNPAQLSNFTRYTRKLPAGAESTIITRGADGAVQLSTKVPGRVPGSYATYDKVVDASGTTIGYTKTTVAPDGTIVHVKDKLLP